MKKIVLLVLISLTALFSATLEQAQHRLPPVIYSLDIPKVVKSGETYTFKWTVMGYHDTYNMELALYKVGEKNPFNKAHEKLSPIKVTKGLYRYGNIHSKRFWYQKSVKIPKLDKNQDLIVRFFISPPYDDIDTSFLSCLVPGGLGYDVADTSGRKIKIKALISGDENSVNSVNVLINSIQDNITADAGGWGGQCKAYLQKVFNSEASNYTINGHKPTMPLNDTSNNSKSWKSSDSFITIDSYNAGSSQNQNKQNILTLLRKAKKGDYLQMYWNPNSHKQILTPHTIMFFQDVSSDENHLNWGDSNLNKKEIVRVGTKYPWGTTKTLENLANYLSNRYCTNNCGATLYRINPNLQGK